MAYQAVNAILERHDADMGAAEAHGIATGMLCVALQADAGNWLDELMQDVSGLDDEDKALLLALFDRTRELLDPETDEFTFDLFLPEENEPLHERVEALRTWCQGFLFGVGYQQGAGDWPGNSGEVMRDLIEFTKIDSDVEGEDNENALMQIHEYVRAAVITVRDEFAEQTGDHETRH